MSLKKPFFWCHVKALMKGNRMSVDAHAPSQPWWRFGHVWLVVSGPLLVVVASVVSAMFAFQGNDTDFNKDAQQVKSTLEKAPANQKKALTPAIQSRNNAATDAP